MKKITAALVLLSSLLSVAGADTINPMSNTLADSTNVASSIIMRDSSGNFAATGATFTGPLTLATATTTQLNARADAVGSTFLVQERNGGALVSNAYNLCVSTLAATGSYVYLSVSTNSPTAVAGATCNK